MKVKNPILSGFYPDPSICRVEDDYYLVCSTFAYFPGVPIFHSKDLVNWEQIGNILNRESQLPLTGCGHSEGIFAPTLRYFNGTFYMITTNISDGGNFIVTAQDPAGPWSEPYHLGADAQGIDPSLFFDEDGKCYYTGTRPNQKGVRYGGDWEVWIQELDLQTMMLTGESRKIWKGAFHNVIWPEGPHLYKRNGFYYLMIAEGGTGPNHSVTVARSRKVEGPYESNPNNPILTHRHLGSTYPVVYVGHGDLVQAHTDDWYMVLLASRPYKGYTVMGRETFIAKVVWEQDWPVVNPGVGKLELDFDISMEPHPHIPENQFYLFTKECLAPEFLLLRGDNTDKYSLTSRPGCLRLYTAPDRIEDVSKPAYVGVRQRDFHYQAEVLMEFQTEREEEAAGLAIIQSNLYHIRFEAGVYKGSHVVRVTLCENGVLHVAGQREIEDGQIWLKIVCRGLEASFYYKGAAAKTWIPLAEQVDIRLLSTEIAGGFTGCTVGMFATANETESRNYADFFCFSYNRI